MPLAAALIWNSRGDAGGVEKPERRAGVTLLPHRKVALGRSGVDMKLKE